MDWLGIVGIAGTLGTFGFGVLSLYQSTELKALRRAIRAHAQTEYNEFWMVGHEMEQIKMMTDSHPDDLDRDTVVNRRAAANAISISGRFAAINFGRCYADFVPHYEAAWKPDPIPQKP